jgi:hypothetical protein
MLHQPDPVRRRSTRPRRRRAVWVRISSQQTAAPALIRSEAEPRSDPFNGISITPSSSPPT